MQAKVRLWYNIQHRCMGWCPRTAVVVHDSAAMVASTDDVIFRPEGMGLRRWQRGAVVLAVCVLGLVVAVVAFHELHKEDERCVLRKAESYHAGDVFSSHQATILFGACAGSRAVDAH